jgi:hypothetical protein
MKGQALYFLWNLTIITVSQIVKADALPLVLFEENSTAVCDEEVLALHSRRRVLSLDRIYP